MTKRKSNLTDSTITRASRGVTLVELLVVITILTVIFAVMIPRLRAVSADRNIREAARVVSSAFSRASSRAVNDGLSGLMILPNPNFQQATFDNFDPDPNELGPFYAGTRIFQMRELPAYIGEEENSLAWSTPDIPLVIDKPFEHDEDEGRLIIQANDEISFNGSSYRYRILEVNEEDQFRLNLTLDLAGGPAPAPNLGEPRDEGHDPSTNGVPFVIHRQPRRLESSLVELPEGYIIDLRYSGPLLPNDPSTSEDEMLGTFLNESQAGDEPLGVVLHFDANGVISRMFLVNTNSFEPVGAPLQPIAALDWLVTEFDPNAIGPDGNYISKLDDPIFSPNNKWVTVDHLTGGVHVASSAVPVPVGNDLRAEINGSLVIARNRQSTGQ